MREGEDICCICNSDVVFGKRVIGQCVEGLVKHGRGVTFPFSLKGGPLPPNFKQMDERCNLQPYTDVNTGGMAGWCFFIPRSTYEKVGHFDEQFTLWYGDSNYQWRITRAGLPPHEVRSCLLHHFESRTILSMPQQFECYGWRAKDAINWQRWTEGWAKEGK
jgi:GT2 family glycosyltransferase